MAYMETVSTQGVWATYYLLTIFLFLKAVFTNVRTAGWRTKAGIARTPEDAKFYAGRPQPTAEQATEAKATYERWLRIQENDFENIPWATVLFGFAILYVKPTMHVVLYVIFVAARFLFTIFYANALSPWRSIAFEFGILSTIIVALGAIVEAFILA